MIGILIPSSGRSEKIAMVVENATRHTSLRHRVIVIVEEPEYHDYLHALKDVKHAELVLNKRSRNYAGAINTVTSQGLFREVGDYFFCGADDLNFHPGWDTNAVTTMLALPHLRVVGTNDLWNQYVLEGTHATHYLVDRRYTDEVGGVIDGAKGHLLYEGYDHNYTDTECIGTAKARAIYSPCPQSIVEHMHWSAGKSPKDATAMKTSKHIDKDAELYLSRRHMWWEVSR